MGTEIERKFLVISENWRGNTDSKNRLLQGYLANAHHCTVRVRLEETLHPPHRQPNRGWVTIKGPVQGITRREFEYEIPPGDAHELLTQFCGESIIDKIRYTLNYKGKLWEIDEFAGPNQGLLIAEMTLTHESESFPRPDWLGPEVSHDPRYFNSQLIKHPFRAWSTQT